MKTSKESHIWMLWPAVGGELKKKQTNTGAERISLKIKEKNFF